MGRLGHVGASKKAPEKITERVQTASWSHVGTVLRPSWGILGPSWVTRKPSLGRLVAILGLSEAILGRLRACNGGKMRQSILNVVFD